MSRCSYLQETKVSQAQEAIWDILSFDKAFNALAHKFTFWFEVLNLMYYFTDQFLMSQPGNQ